MENKEAGLSLTELIIALAILTLFSAAFLMAFPTVINTTRSISTTSVGTGDGQVAAFSLNKIRSADWAGVENTSDGQILLARVQEGTGWECWAWGFTPKGLYQKQYSNRGQLSQSLNSYPDGWGLLVTDIEPVDGKYVEVKENLGKNVVNYSFKSGGVEFKGSHTAKTKSSSSGRPNC